MPVRYQTLQALRFIAAMLVLVYHCATYFSGEHAFDQRVIDALGEGARWGVFLFFSISGFVLAHALQRTGPARFLAARAIRIFPGFWLAVAAALAMQWLLHGRVTAPSDLGKALTLLPLGPLIYPLGVEWTLVYEVFFYFLLALLWLPASARFLHVSILGWIAAIAVVSVLAPSWATQQLPTADVILWSSINLAFAFGVLAHRLHRTVASRALWLGLGAAAVFAAMGAMPARDEIRHAFTGLSTACVVLVASARAVHADLPPDSRLARLGDTSYGIYLMHVPILTMWLSAGPRVDSPTLALAALLGLTIAGSIAFGAFEFRFYSILRERLRGLTASRAPEVQPA